MVQLQVCAKWLQVRAGCDCAGTRAVLTASCHDACSLPAPQPAAKKAAPKKKATPKKKAAAKK